MGFQSAQASDKCQADHKSATAAIFCQRFISKSSRPTERAASKPFIKGIERQAQSSQDATPEPSHSLSSVHCFSVDLKVRLAFE
jgi:hypothetical protein